MHKEVAKVVSASMARHIFEQNKKINIVRPCFEVGDFVVVRTAQGKGHKMRLRWIGSRNVTRVLGSLVLEVESLAREEVEQVHATDASKRLDFALHHLRVTSLSVYWITPGSQYPVRPYNPEGNSSTRLTTELPLLYRSSILATGASLSELLQPQVAYREKWSGTPYESLCVCTSCFIA